MDFSVTMLHRDVGFEQFDGVAGGETAGIPFAAWMAERLSLPMYYVRKKPKGFGRDAQIEGDSVENKRILLVEDLTTDGGSKLKFAEALRHAGAEVQHTLVVFYYDIFPETPPQTCRAPAITPLSRNLEGRVGGGAQRQTSSMRQPLIKSRCFLNEPLKWSAAHGGISEMAI